MLSFIRLLAAFLVGGVVGAAAVLLLQPTFSIVVTNAPAGVTTLVDAHPPVVDEPEFVAPPSPVPAPGAAAVAPTAPVAVAPAQAPSPAAPVPIDYAQVAARPAFWPAEVRAVGPSVITFSEDGKKTGEIRIASGLTLQLSGVQPDGTLELRAEGRKFTLHARHTDFDALVRKKANELLARAAGAAAEPVMVTPAAPAPAVVPSAPVKPKGPLTMQQKLDALYGRTPEEPAATSGAPSAVPAPPAAAPAPALAPAAPAPAPAPVAPAEPSGKDADLKRRMDGLFRPANGPAR